MNLTKQEYILNSSVHRTVSAMVNMYRLTVRYHKTVPSNSYLKALLREGRLHNRRFCTAPATSSGHFTPEWTQLIFGFLAITLNAPEVTRLSSKYLGSCRPRANNVWVYIRNHQNISELSTLLSGPIRRHVDANYGAHQNERVSVGVRQWTCNLIRYSEKHLLSKHSQCVFYNDIPLDELLTSVL